jgi:hypothetical protein
MAALGRFALLNLLEFVAVNESADGPERTCWARQAMSALGGEADLAGR